MRYEMDIEYYSKCSCGALTLFHRNGRSYTCDQENRRIFLPGIDLRKIRKLNDSYMCDHCTNRWGLDLCACGSGEYFWECDNGFPECGRPMQEYGGHDFVAAQGAWLARA